MALIPPLDDVPTRHHKLHEEGRASASNNNAGKRKPPSDVLGGKEHQGRPVFSLHDHVKQVP